MNFLDLTKSLGNEFGGLAEDGVEAGDVTGYIDTGSYTLNLLLSGSIFKGLPENRITALAGEESTGKTFFTIAILKNFLDNNPGAGVIYFESEGAVSKQLLQSRGVDTTRVYVAPVSTIEEFKSQALRAVDKHLETSSDKRGKVMFVLDSLGMLSTGKEMEDTSTGKTTRDMTRAPLIRSAFRVLTLKLGRAGIPLIVTNHVYDQIGAMFPTKQVAGGGGLKYAASTIVTLGKSKEKDGTDVIGSRIRLRVPKARLTRENVEVETLLHYEKGLNRYYGLVDLAVKYGIFMKVSTRLELPDGRKVYEKEINTNPEKYFTQEILEKIDEFAQKDFLYGSDFHKQETIEDVE